MRDGAWSKPRDPNAKLSCDENAQISASFGSSSKARLSRLSAAAKSSGVESYLSKLIARARAASWRASESGAVADGGGVVDAADGLVSAWRGGDHIGRSA